MHKRQSNGIGKIEVIIIVAVIGYLALYSLNRVGPPENPITKAIVSLYESLWGPIERNPPLVMHVQRGDLDSVRNLLDQGIDPNTKGVNGMTALMWASGKGHTTIVNLLLERGANPNVTNKWNSTALFSAAYQGHYAIVQALLSKGADVAIRDNKGKTALDNAQEKKHLEVANLLKNAGAKAE